jgi:hypothetical protein
MPEETLREAASPTENNFGLTMRDYSAASALNALLSEPQTGSIEQPQARYAEVAYAYADAMLVARGSGLA